MAFGDEVLSANEGVARARPVDVATQQRSIRVSRVRPPK
jgi:hypothetical protein